MTGQYPQNSRQRSRLNQQTIGAGPIGSPVNQMTSARTSFTGSYEPQECGLHDIVYKGDPGCPMCAQDREIKQLRASLTQARNEMERLYVENTRMQTQVDIVAAIREAAEVLDDEDLAFLKAVLYEYRDTKSVALKTTHGSKGKRRGQPAANGFIVMPRAREPYGHVCSSVGGIAIANYFDEANNTVGPIEATKLLLKGMSTHLPGGNT